MVCPIYISYSINLAPQMDFMKQIIDRVTA